MSVLLETSLGDMVFDLHTDLAPKVLSLFLFAVFAPASSLLHSCYLPFSSASSSGSALRLGRKLPALLRLHTASGYARCSRPGGTCAF